jgi:hypothetical protein
MGMGREGGGEVGESGAGSGNEDVTVCGDEFDDGDFRFRCDRHVARDPCALHRIRKNVEDGNLVHVCHTVGLDD